MATQPRPSPTSLKDKLSKLFSEQTLLNIREATHFVCAHVALVAAKAEAEVAVQVTTKATFKRKASLVENDGPVKKAKPATAVQLLFQFDKTTF
ncbi:hypothetical protein Rhopal_005113-T1 [Rhodotorula paludigena]|uniref:Uncharacterized protein n=1 Tax=Rhodotorula paludigena TaxID=86838 RepID=A0AAV5GQA8_9BASI|nr:hypothetical protein Rhopal_005113-T1 [Rhodotorula paludigena]